MKSIEIILTLLDYFFRQWHEQQAQRQRDELENAPDTWFKSHFSGVSGNSTTQATQADTRD